MIECIFTIDYEIYGNGSGSLEDHVVKPTERLARLFSREDARMVNFVEALEFEQIETLGTDPASSQVREQIRDLYRQGHEIALHLHPQWANAHFEDGRWKLDYAEYNLCVLEPERITEIVDRAIAYLRDVLEDPEYRPFSFRAGNWLFQPTQAAAEVLAARGVKIDSSVFKGGRQHQHGLDYRAALQNGDYWRFQNDVNVREDSGDLLELPIHTDMVPFWRMLTGKRVGLQRKSANGGSKKAVQESDGETGGGNALGSSRWEQARDYLRPTYPLKFDFCRMTFSEMRTMLERVLRDEIRNPSVYRPLVAIGHSKDLEDFESIERLLDWLKQHEIPVVTLESAYSKCMSDA